MSIIYINSMNNNLISIWHTHFKNSGEIPVSENLNLNDLDWIEDNYELIIDWIENTFEDSSEKDEHLNEMKTILKSLNNIDDFKNENYLCNSQYTKNYRQINKEKLKEKRIKYYTLHKDNLLCEKILDNLNRGITNKPRPQTIKKYNLHYDMTSKQWSRPLSKG